MRSLARYSLAVSWAMGLHVICIGNTLMELSYERLG